MAQRILAVFVGLLLGMMVISAGHMMSTRWYPPPETLNPADNDALLEYIRSMPLVSIAFIIISHALGAFSGAYIAARFADSYKYAVGLFVAVLFLVATSAHAIILPHSFTVAATDFFAVFFAGWGGTRIGARIRDSGRE